MNAIELFHKDGKPAKVWYCEKCRHVAGDERTANLCCDWHYNCRICGEKCDRTHYLLCTKCEQAEEDKKELERFNKAEKLTEWDGPVYCDGANHNEGFFDSLEDFLDYDYDEEFDSFKIKYVWVCNKVSFVVASIDHLMNNISDQAYEDFDIDRIKGLDELEKAIDKFNELNQKHCFYEIDYSKVILLEKEPNGSKTS